MSMELQIQQDIKAAMLAKEKTRLESLRAIKAAILLAKTADGSESISDEAVVKIIQKLVKQRKETAEIYKQQNREELAANELAEAIGADVVACVGTRFVLYRESENKKRIELP